MDLIAQFIDEHEDVVIKPLDGMGGTSVFRVGESDPNRNVIVETVSRHGRHDGHGADATCRRSSTATSASC